MSNFRNRTTTGYTARDARVRPTCPFCGTAIARPSEPDVKRPGEMPVGSCSCGAVYAYDATGHNLGAAFSEALVFACNMDWDLAWNLLPGEDYLEELVENYDMESNFIIPTGSYEGRRVSGALYFIRLHNDIQEVTGQGVQKRLDRSRPAAVTGDSTYRPNAAKTLTKKEIEDLVSRYEYAPLLETATRDTKVLRYLQRLLYSGDELLRLRAADILGKVCGIIAQTRPGPVSNLMQRMVTSVTNADFGSSSWGAVDAIGEIISNAPDIFAGYIPVLYQFLEEEPALRPGVLRVLAKIAAQNNDLIDKSLAYFLKYVHADDPATRGYTLLLIGNLGARNLNLGAAEAREALNRLTEDGYEVGIYMNGCIEKRRIGQLAAEALKKLKK
ncbi:DVU0298 family protein [Desulfoscipio geothermicus]|uniref:PBS lyase n=1 Tax=Desulfoscipio geothermicus DSM 3669 TaxID=1121426 RepID=A0A1I6CZ00_9FIRM|nr:DVU0298 family protein [Desulfoscipio geothermicus]SFQ98448.1 hypothetical protein SAMN05660706_103103 [Desulfoscipio geothermicus DSM 3669]